MSNVGDGEEHTTNREDIPRITLEDARQRLSTRFTELQAQFASLSLLSRDDPLRVDHYQDVKQELDAIAEDLTRLDYYNPIPVQVDDNLSTASQPG